MILVTGGTGFLGAHLICGLLPLGKPIRAIRRSTSSLSEFDYIFSVNFSHLKDAEKEKLKSSLEWVEADITDLPSLNEAFQGIREVYHCAAIVSFHSKDRKRMMEVNAEGTTHIVNLCLIHGIDLLVHVSSIAALGREKSGIEISEGSKWVHSPLNTEYAISKHKSEMEVWRGIEEGLQAIIVNPGVILGVGDWNKGGCKLFSLPWNNFPFYTNGVNGYVDVRDVTRAIIHLREIPAARLQRYILTGENLSMKTFMHTLAEHYGKKKATFRVTPVIAYLSPYLFQILGWIRGKRPTITRENARSSIQIYLYNNKKIQEQTGFRFTPMNDTLAYISNHYIQSKSS